MHDHAPNEARLAHCGGVEALLRALRPGGASPRVREAALEVLAKVQRAEHKLRVLPAGGVPLLVRALRPPSTPRTPYVASVALHNLSITGQAAKRAIAAAGALPLLVGLLQLAAGQEDTLALDTRESAADALCTLAYANMEICVAIMRMPEALPALVRSLHLAAGLGAQRGSCHLRRATPELLQASACHLATALRPPPARRRMLQVAMLRHPCHALRGAAVQALNNLCGHPACAFALVEAGCSLGDLRGLTESPNPEVRWAANQLVRPLTSASLVYGLAAEAERWRAQQVGGRAGRGGGAARGAALHRGCVFGRGVPLGLAAAAAAAGDAPLQGQSVLCAPGIVCSRRHPQPRQQRTRHLQHRQRQRQQESEQQEEEQQQGQQQRQGQRQQHSQQQQEQR